MNQWSMPYSNARALLSIERLFIATTILKTSTEACRSSQFFQIVLVYLARLFLIVEEMIAQKCHLRLSAREFVAPLIIKFQPNDFRSTQKKANWLLKRMCRERELTYLLRSLFADFYRVTKVFKQKDNFSSSCLNSVPAARPSWSWKVDRTGQHRLDDEVMI